jgi:ribose-phosphate pyrophosphokinase
VSGGAVAGDVANRTVLLVDDLISSGTTLARAADACRRAGAGEIFAAASHGVFAPDASQLLEQAPIVRIAVLDHVPPFALSQSLVEAKLEVIESSGLIAEAIRRMHEGGSIVGLGEIGERRHLSGPFHGEP